MEERVKEIDYLKCIFITLMIIFHLVYIGDKYPYAKQVVYTFHMSAFLIISGYLVNIQKGLGAFLKKYLWIFIPYACMEAGYIIYLLEKMSRN
jgi:fucose 4-O-acetylase-like acetyltransferase